MDGWMVDEMFYESVLVVVIVFSTINYKIKPNPPDESQVLTRDFL